ncbi:TPA: P-type DNA transfer protein VirB5 [Neisseria meningitidis]
MKFKMKTGVLLTAAAIALSPVVNAGGIPVFDGASVAQAIKQVENSVQQINQLKSQLQQMKAQYKAITGSRGLGEILTNTGLKSALPQDWQKVYDSIKNGGYKGLDGAARAIADASKLTEKCKAYQDGSERQKSCQTAAVQSAQTELYIKNALDNAEARLVNLKKLATRINGATDPKAIADLTARINIEQAALQNEQTRLQLFARLSDIQEKNAEQAARQADFEAQQKANCAAVSEKARAKQPYCR